GLGWKPGLGAGGVSRRAPDCPPCDIAPAEALGPVDQIDCPVGPLARLLDAGGDRGDIEHPSAVGQHAVAVAPGAGVENLHALYLCRRLEAADLPALLLAIRIALV